MIKPKSKPKAATRLIARKIAKPVSRKRSAPVSSSPAARLDTEHARIIAMLGTSTGATIAVIMTTTDWQQYSVRGFLAGGEQRRQREVMARRRYLCVRRHLERCVSLPKSNRTG
jgi:hypothetical protein